MKKVFVVLAIIVIIVIIGITMFVNHDSENDYFHFEKDYNLEYEPFVAYKTDFDVKDVVDVKTIGIINKNSLIAEFKNTSEEFVLLEDIRVSVDDAHTFKSNNKSNAVTIRPNSSVFLCFDSGANSLDESMNFTYNYEDFNYNAKSHMFPNIDVKCFDNGKGTIVATIANNTGLLVTDLYGALMLYNDNKIVYYQLFEYNGNIMPSTTYYKDFWGTDIDDITFDKCEVCIIDAQYDTKASRAYDYIKCDIIDRSADKIIVRVKNTCDYAIEVNDLVIRYFDESGNCYGGNTGYLGTIMGKSVIYTSFRDNSFRYIGFDKPIALVNMLDCQFPNRYVERKSKCNVKKNEIEFSFCSEASENAKFFAILYKDGKVVDLIYEGEFYQNKNEQMKYTYPIKSEYDTIETGIAVGIFY